MTTNRVQWSETVAVGPYRLGDWIAGVLGFVTLIGAAAGVGRLLVGLQASTALTDGYPWGIWIGFDFGLIAFAGAGFTMAAVVHILHLERYHTALRPALLAGLFGYVAVLLLLVLDLGRPDRFYHFILFWNLHSPLFEISWCVLLYTTVLVIEVSPDVLARFGWTRLAAPLRWVTVPVTIIGVTLSTLHQSTLGTLYLNMPHRLDGLWYTPILPILFYISSIMAGLSLAVVAYKLAVRIHDADERPAVTIGLLSAVMWVGMLYLALKIGEVVVSGEWPALLRWDGLAWLWWLELAVGVVAPVLLWITPGLRRRSGIQWIAALLILCSVLMNRFDATLFAQSPPPGTAPYNPHILEWLSTLGVLAGAALAWYLCVRFVVRLGGQTRHCA